MAGLLVMVASCTSGLPDDGSERITLADGSTALSWGDGEYGVVLVPGEGEMPEDRAPLAGDIAANQMTVVAVNPADATSADPDLRISDR